MKKLIVLAILLGVLGCMAFADTVSSPGSFTGNQVCSTVAGACAATFQSQTAASGVQGNPNWNDFSKDGSNLNVGYVLTGTNAGAGLNNNFLSNTAGVFGSYLGSAASSNTLATNFNFVREALSVTVTVLYTN